MKRQGFTLIEMLVVIAIITILAGMLVPAVGAARRSARIGACMSNQHNVGLAIQMYLNEPSSNFPGSSAWNSASSVKNASGYYQRTNSGTTLSGHALAALYRFVGGGLAVFSCPGEPTGNTVDMTTYDGIPDPAHLGLFLPNTGLFLTNTGYIMDTATNPGSRPISPTTDIDNGIPLNADPARAIMVCGRRLNVDHVDGLPKPDPTMHGNPAGAVVLFVSMNAEFVLDADPVDEAVLLNPGYPASSAIVDNIYAIDGTLRESQDCSAAPPSDDIDTLVPPLDPKDPGYGG